MTEARRVQRMAQRQFLPRLTIKKPLRKAVFKMVVRAGLAHCVLPCGLVLKHAPSSPASRASSSEASSRQDRARRESEQPAAGSSSDSMHQKKPLRKAVFKMVVRAGFEPANSKRTDLQSACFSHLHISPIKKIGTVGVFQHLPSNFFKFLPCIHIRVLQYTSAL